MLDSEALTRLGACEEGHFPPGGSLWYGATLAGRYKGEQFLGEGFHGSVHRSLDLRTGAQVAIKQNIHHQQAVHEACLLAMIQHPGVVSLSDFLYDERAAYLVLPFIEGLPLFAWTPEGHQPPLEVGEVLEVGWQLAATFTYLHSLPVVHRDLHSGNLLRMPDGRIRLIDFTLAGCLVADAPTTPSELSSEVDRLRSLLARLLPRGAPEEYARWLRGCPHPGMPFTAEALERDLLALAQEYRPR